MPEGALSGRRDAERFVAPSGLSNVPPPRETLPPRTTKVRPEPTTPETGEERVISESWG